ncbi:MAG TPA: ATPase, T2SS/T4P/T4SS family, partial [Polyangiales bacterium]|nr:ATPase, T2SS/T4P/T4SS family [Polyangiales bacterium]
IEARDFSDLAQITVGRDVSCGLPLSDLTVSRRHAVLSFESDGVRVEDISTNGTFVGENGYLQKSTQTVRYGTRIRVGNTELSVLMKGAAIPTVAPAQTVPAPAPKPTAAVTSGEDIDALRREIHRELLTHLDMTAIDKGNADDPTLRPRVLAALRRIVDGMSERLPAGLSQATLVGQMADEALGLGPLEGLLADPAVSEIMVLDAHHIYVERSGKIALSDSRFTDDERVRAAIERIVTPLGRRIDESSPLVDARLANGSRVNVVIRPIALRGSCITIRKFSSKPFALEDLCERGALSEAMARFLVRSVKAKKNIVIAGGTGSGKTTLLNVLSGAIPEQERIVTIEDAAELQLAQPHVVSLEARPENMEGKGEISIRTLVKNALRMRPDRIVVGECRGGEALDMLQAMNTGHDGSLTTTHANSPAEALSRLETLALMAGVGLPQRAIREQISKSVHLLVQQSRLSDGSRKVTAIVEIVGLDERDQFLLRPLFQYVRRGTGLDGKADGEFVSTGYLPSYLPELIVKGLLGADEAFL